MTIAPAIHVYCDHCGDGLPIWQQALLSIAGVLIAFAILYGLAALFRPRSGRLQRRRRK